MKKFSFLSLAVIFAVAAVFTACKKENSLKEGTPNTYTFAGVTQAINYASYFEDSGVGVVFFGLCPTEPGKKGMLNEEEYISLSVVEPLLDEEIELVPFFGDFRFCMIVVKSDLGMVIYTGAPDGYKGDVLGTLEVNPGRKSGEYTINIKMGESGNRKFLLNYSGKLEEADQAEDICSLVF